MGPEGADRFRSLPERVPLEETVAVHETGVDDPALRWAVGGLAAGGALHAGLGGGMTVEGCDGD